VTRFGFGRDIHDGVPPAKLRFSAVECAIDV
jgi:hypothetical protein